MFKKISIKNFRGFDSIEVDNLEAVNLVTGKNGAGKTAFLEAIFLNSGPENASLAIKLASFRGEVMIQPNSERIFKSVFHDYGPKAVCEIKAEWKGRYDRNYSHRTLTIKPAIKPGEGGGRGRVNGLDFDYRSAATRSAKSKCYWATGPFAQNLRIVPTAAGGIPAGPVQMVQESTQITDHIDGRIAFSHSYFATEYIHQIITDATKTRKKSLIVNGVRTLDDRVRDIIALSENNENVVYVDVGGDELLPLSVMGAGFYSVLHMMCHIIDLEDGILLIDEIEDGLHYSVVPTVINFLLRTAREKQIQLFITTHSDELLSVLVSEARALQQSSLCAVRLLIAPQAETRGEGRKELPGHKIKAVTVSEEELEVSREASVEIR